MRTKSGSGGPAAMGADYTEGEGLMRMPFGPPTLQQAGGIEHQAHAPVAADCGASQAGASMEIGSQWLDNRRFLPQQAVNEKCDASFSHSQYHNLLPHIAGLGICVTRWPAKQRASREELI